MLLAIGTALGFLLAGSALLFVRGLVGLFRRRWRVAVVRLLGGLVLFAVTVLLLVGASSLRLGGTSAAEKAAVLAGKISTLMNLSFLGIPFGALLGFVAELRGRRARSRCSGQGRRLP
jgi:hypothetical protein